MHLRVGIVGATGVAGQQFLQALSRHPWFEIVRLSASERSAATSLRESIRRSPNNECGIAEDTIPKTILDMRVHDASTMPLDGLDLVFSAVESDAAQVLEPRFAREVPVVSTASAFRMAPDVPIVIPAINADHLDILKTQQERRGFRGFIVPIPNCTTTGLAIALAPLVRAFGVDKVIMTSLQATSGAGRSPGVAALDVIDNVIPYIPREEEKVERELQKIFGTLRGNTIEPADIAVSATCTRVSVIDGHVESVFASLCSPQTLDNVKSTMEQFGADMNPATHPTAPQRWVTVDENPYHPQPRLHRDRDRGLTTSVGRIRADHVLGPNGVKFVLLSHNTKMGAAAGATLLAEELVRRGAIHGRRF